MPALVWLGRRWKIGSDDVAVPCACLVLTRFVLGAADITIIVILAVNKRTSFCDLAVTVWLAGLLALFVSAPALEILLTRASARGASSRARRSAAARAAAAERAPRALGGRARLGGVGRRRELHVAVPVLRRGARARARVALRALAPVPRPSSSRPPCSRCSSPTARLRRAGLALVDAVGGQGLAPALRVRARRRRHAAHARARAAAPVPRRARPRADRRAAALLLVARRHAAPPAPGAAPTRADAGAGADAGAAAQLTDGELGELERFMWYALAVYGWPLYAFRKGGRCPPRRARAPPLAASPRHRCCGCCAARPPRSTA